MNNDIKEITHNLKECCDIHKDENWVVYQKDRIYEIINYITNLQIIEQQYSAILSENAELENKVNDLEDRINKAIEKNR